MNEITITAIIKRQRACLYIYKKQKNAKPFYTKSQTLFKKQDNFRHVFIYKNPDTLRYAIFMKFLKLDFIYKNHDTLRYVTFLYTKIQTLLKKQENFRHVFIYKNTETVRYVFFHWIFEIVGGGRGHFYTQKKSLCITFLYAKTIHFVLHFYIQKSRNFASHCYMQKNALCITFLFI